MRQLQNHCKANSWNEFFDFNSSFGRQNEVGARLADLMRSGVRLAQTVSKTVASEANGLGSTPSSSTRD